MRLTWTCCLVLVLGCGGGTSGADAGRDAGRTADAGHHVDAGGERDSGIDAGGDIDAGEAPDAGESPDAAVSDAGTDASTPPSDAGPAPDAGPGECHERLGVPCSTSADCGAGFECEIGRCRPQGRELCGGFVGAPCTMPPYTECLYYSSADFGPCFTPAERDCLCRRFPSAFACP